MTNYTVTVEERSGNSVTAEDIINAITISETDPNSITVVASTFVNDAGATSNLYYSSTNLDDSVGSVGDFYINTSSGELWGPKGVTSWSAEPLPLIPKRFVFTQAAASASWIIPHTLKGFPSVTVVDSAGTVVVGTVVYNSTSSITVTFEAAFAGKAYLT